VRNGRIGIAFLRLNAGGNLKSCGKLISPWEDHSIPNPIRKVLSSIRKNRVRALLMGGQACVFYGAAEFSKPSPVLAKVGEKGCRLLRPPVFAFAFFPSCEHC
jgi:hypothetical protein